MHSHISLCSDVNLYNLLLMEALFNIEYFCQLINVAFNKKSNHYMLDTTNSPHLFIYPYFAISLKIYSFIGFIPLQQYIIKEKI